MKLSTLLAIGGAALVSAADDSNQIAWPTSVDANEFVSAIYSPSPIPSEVSPFITPLATTLYSVQSSFVHDDKFPSVTSDIISAVTHAPNPVSAMQAMLTGDWQWKEVVTQEWYDKNVPKDSKEFVSQYLEKWDKAAEEVVKKSAAPRGVSTGLAMAVAGVVVGVIAAVL
ncbi:hypothetical protein B0T21DRAFT_358311 [Apiosordaria backusii]|uniref:Uncharacterized protein n=1 Tax=Apiosordaria backusii TaxID=314023 RepID=A0AA40K3N7_9PEZI|nr:hypothetical protein B0T21DRAFT_358311 [Apiosordaria backusii]